MNKNIYKNIKTAVFDVYFIKIDFKIKQKKKKKMKKNILTLLKTN